MCAQKICEYLCPYWKAKDLFSLVLVYDWLNNKNSHKSNSICTVSILRITKRTKSKPHTFESSEGNVKSNTNFRVQFDLNLFICFFLLCASCRFLFVRLHCGCSQRRRIVWKYGRSENLELQCICYDFGLHLVLYSLWQ